MLKKSVSRRHFLKASGATLFLPVLESFIPSRAFAQANNQKSFVGIAAFNGLFRMSGPNSIMMPTTNPTSDQIPGFSSSMARHKIHYKSLTELQSANGKISELIDSRFNPYLSKMLMLQGFDYPSLGWRHHHGHFGNMADSFSGPNGMPAMASIEQVMAYSVHSANRTGFYKDASLVGQAIPYNANSAETGNYGASHYWANPNDKLNSSIKYSYPNNNPAALWDKYFKADSQAPSNAKGTLVDRTLASYQALRANPRLSAADKVRLDIHTNMLHETQKRVMKVGQMCNSLKPATNLSDRKLILRTLNDVIVSLIACGRCHSFLGWANSIISSNAEAWHTWSHEGYDGETDKIANASSYDNVVAQNKAVIDDMFLDLIAKLDSAGQLDNSLVVYIQEHSNRGHQSFNVPAMIAGSAGGVLKTGMYIDYRNLSSGEDKVYTRCGYPITQLLANVLRAVDVTPQEYEALNKNGYTHTKFIANSGYGHTKLDDGFTGHYNSSAWNNHNLSDWLPLIT